MDTTVAISDDEFEELFGAVNDIPPVKPSNMPTSERENTEEINDQELDELMCDLDWNEEPVKSMSNVTEVLDPSTRHLEVLRKHFGHAKFRPMQWEIIHNIINLKRDGCVIMATGYGKSLCYQFPPVFCNGTALIITPLISLMEDQTLALEAANIPACYLGAGQAGQGKKMDKLVEGDYRVVYLTPEFCVGEIGQSLFQRLLSSRRITLVAIDEAHCVSQWGHDFRHSYRKLGKIRDIFGSSIPILALTATATKQVQDDICSSLKLRNPLRVCSGFDRPNLYLAVRQKGLSIIKDLERLMVGGKNSFGGPTIVYCPTKKTTENVAKALEDYGINCRYYHADLNAKVRKEVHHMFVRDEIQVIVATVAFGMGIDKPDVRLIIHYGAPKDMESYYQEVGRAGRDGLQSQCYCYYTAGDFVTNKYFLSNLTGKAYDHRKSAMLKMEQYLQSRQCRRQLLLSHFEPGRAKKLEKSVENCCDNCTFRHANNDKEPDIDGLNADGTYDFSEDTRLLLSAADYFGGRFGMTAIIAFLYGSKLDKFREPEMKNEIFGKGKHKTKEWWKGLGRMLLQEGYLEEVAGKFNVPGRFPVSTVRVGSQGRDFLSRSAKSSEKEKINLYPNADMLNLLKRSQRKFRLPVSTSWNEPVVLPLFPATSQTDQNSTVEHPKMSKEEEQKEGKLYGELLALRNALAKQHSYMPYMVANNKTLLDVAALRPSTTSNLALVEGFNTAKIEKFGTAIVNKVQEFCKEHDLAMNKILTSQPESAAGYGKKQQCDLSALYSSLSDTVKISYDLFQNQGKDLATVAAERQFQISTVGNHLSQAVRAGLPLDVKRLGLTKDIHKTIVDVIRSPHINSDISRLKPIKEHCPENISYEHIKIVISMLVKQYGIQNDILNKEITDVMDIDTFRHNLPEKKRLSTLTTSDSPSEKSVPSPLLPIKQQTTAKRKMDLSLFLQKNFKDSHASQNNSFSTTEKEEQLPATNTLQSKVGSSELLEDDDIFENIDESVISAAVSESNHTSDKTQLKRKLKDYQQEMKKKIKTSSLFRK